MIRIVVLVFAGVALAACKQAGPPNADTTSPGITLTAFNRMGNPLFTNTGTAPADACAKFNQFPARFLLAVGDEGGVRSAAVRLFGGRFVAGSVNVGPGAPESTWTIAPDGPSAELLSIRLGPPAPETVRTGLLALFEIEPETAPPIAIRARAADYLGNLTSLYQVDARASGDAVVCRGDR